MASKSFSPGTVIDSAWLNDVNGMTYGLKSSSTGAPIITTALGFTPYSAANPSGYQTAANVTSAITSYGYQTAANVSSALAPYATTASLSSYMPVAGGNFTGPITGTSGTFSAGIFANDGSVTVPSIAFANDNGRDTGFYHPADGIIGVTCNTQQIMQYQVGTVTVYGTMTAATVTQTSDERTKENWSPVQPDFLPKLAGIEKVGMFDWIDSKETSLGVGAQSLEPILPAAVHTDEDGKKTVNYGAAAMVAVVELTKLVLELQAKIKQLEEGK